MVGQASKLLLGAVQPVAPLLMAQLLMKLLGQMQQLGQPPQPLWQCMLQAVLPLQLLRQRTEGASSPVASQSVFWNVQFFSDSAGAVVELPAHALQQRVALQLFRSLQYGLPALLSLLPRLILLVDWRSIFARHLVSSPQPVSPMTPR